MRNRLRRPIFTLVVLVLTASAPPAWAARPGLRHYTAEDGLPQAQVTAITQDDDGYLWVGTLAGGVARYNGYRWDLFDSRSGLLAESVTCLAAGHGSVFVGTGSGLVRYSAGAWSRIALPPDRKDAFVIAVLPVSAAEVWIATSTGLLRWNGSGPAERPFGADPLSTGFIEALALAPDGSIWLGGRTLRRVTRGPVPQVHAVDGAPPGRVWHIAMLPDGDPVISIGNKGVFRRGAGGWARVGDDRVPGRKVSTLLADAAEPGTLWMGTADSGAFVLRDGEITPFGRAEGLPDIHVNSLHQDREGLIWLGTDNGLVKRGPSAFVTWDEADGLPPDSTVFGMTQDAGGSLWMAAYDDGVVRRSPDGRVRQFTLADGLPGRRVHDVAADATGVWVGTDAGLARIEGDTVVRQEWPKGTPRVIFSLEPFGDGLAILGDGGVSILRGNEVRKVEGLGADPTALAVGPDGTLWSGGHGWGVVGLRDDRIVDRINAALLPSPQVTSVRPDGAGGLWVATEQGAWHRDAGGRTRVVDGRAGLPDSYVYWVGEDREGGVWFGTNRGVAHRPRGRQAFTVYTARDGLGSAECNDDGFFVDRDGTVHISSIGVSVYGGAVRARRHVDPPVRLEGFLVSGQPGGAAIGPDPGPVTFHFAALSYTDEHAVRFRYRLLGAGEEWRETIPGQHETTYAGLGPGDYRFEVTAATPDGRVSREPAAVAFRVRPHWWQTRAAGAAALALTLLGVLAVIRLRERRLLELEALVEERTQELRLVNARNEELAVTDELTGISNRRRLTEGLKAWITLARRQKTPLAVALADLDRFKELNDTEGHGAGDRALVRTALALRGALREVDLLGRWGGEEFLMVLPNCDLPGAREAGERLRRAIEQMDLRNTTTGRLLTVSIGVAVLTDDVDSATELVRRSDQALYVSKAGGRNRVTAFGDAPPSIED